MADDDYTDLVLSGDTYELVRRRRGLLTGVSIPRKIRWCSGLLAVAAALLPLVRSLPPSVRAAYFRGDPGDAALAVAVVTLIGVGCLCVAALGLAGVVVRLVRSDDLTEDQAWTLVGVESVFTGIGFGTGALGVVSSVGIAAIGFAGADAVARLRAAGIDPYLEGVAAVTVTRSSVVAFGCAAAAFVVGVGLETVR